MIQWNEYTWYSKLGALILFVLVVPVLTFYIGMEYEKTLEIQEQAIKAQTQSIRQTPVVQNNYSDENQIIPSVTTPTTISSSTSPKKIATTSTSAGLTYADLLSLASNKFADGKVPLGDNKYVTSGPKKGYVYLCNVRKDNPGSMVNGPWIHGDTWNYLEKTNIQGSVSWPNASFTDVISGTFRKLTGNGLPINHTTGVFPVAKSDPASAYDPNPNTISAQSMLLSLPANPTFSTTPNCMGGEVGVMLSGVPLFNAFDAGLRDAPAHEEQDSCDAHPQGSGEYHYHSLSDCFKDISISTVLGFALDGFPITGPKVADKKYITTDNLDMCHGLTSDVVIDGKKKMTYHYVMTYDFPYSVSCFRGKPVQMQVIQNTGGQSQVQNKQQPQPQSTMQGSQQGQTPPQEAISACASKTQGASCSFTTSQGDTIQGHCDTPPGQSLACVPR